MSQEPPVLKKTVLSPVCSVVEKGKQVKYPTWVQPLLQFFEVIEKESRENRVFYKMKCKACPSAAQEDSQGSEKDKKNIFCDRHTKGFISHLKVRDYIFIPIMIGYFKF